LILTVLALSAATVNVAALPTVTAWATGAVVIIGAKPAGMGESRAARLFKLRVPETAI